MLFADLQGSTAAAEGLDPEDWAEIMNGAFQHLIAPVYRYEGTLARLLGDAVLAFFGAPIAHEDDPVRAARAGLEIIEGMEPYKTEVLERWGVPIDVRVGLNTGLVVVGEVGSDLRVEYTALGDAINVAARMEQTAEPGTVRVTGETWDLISASFEGEELGPVPVKGKGSPVRAYGVSKFIEHDHEGDGGPLVGRDAEVLRLEGLVDRVSGGTGWIASVMGSAGMGKSRLIGELQRRTSSSLHVARSHDDPGVLAWMSAASRSYDSAIPYAMVRDLLSRWLRLDQSSNDYQRIVEATSSLSLHEAPDLAVYLAHVSGVALPPSATALLDELQPPVIQARSRKAMTTYIEAEARRRPVLAVLEDLHWADSMSMAMVDDLMHLADRVPFGLVLSMRPYRDEPTWQVHETAQRDHPHRYHHIDLSSLGADATDTLLDTVLKGLDVTDETRRHILERSDGNPLFVEQIARTIREGGEVETVVPRGLMPLLTARLDRLDDEPRLAAQTASVIGSEFDRRALAALIGDSHEIDTILRDLLRREIFVERPDPSGKILAFQHALMQEAAYSTVLLRTRRQLHRKTAGYLIEAAPDSVQEIARHLIEAGDTEEAFPYLVEAGKRATRSMALADAIRNFTVALENIPADADAEMVVRAHDGLGAAYGLVPDLTHSETTYQQLYEYGEQAGRPSAQITALNRLAFATATLAGDVPKAQAYLEDAQRIAQEVGDEMGMAEYHMNSCFLSAATGQFDSALVHDEEIARIGGSRGVAHIRVEGLARRALNATNLMDFDVAGPAVEDAIRVASELEAEHPLAIVRGMGTSRLLLRSGDVDGALALITESERTLRRFSSFYLPMLEQLMGGLLLDRGDVEAAISNLADGQRRAIQSDRSFGAVVAATSAILGHAYSSVGMEGEVEGLRQVALEALQSPLGEFLGSSVWADLGFTNLALGRAALAREDFNAGLEVSSILQFWERPRLLVGLSLALTQLGDHEEASERLDAAEAFVRKKEVRVFDPLLAYGRGRLLLAVGEFTTALATLDEGLQASLAMGLRTWEVQLAAAAAEAASALGDTVAMHGYTDRVRGVIQAIASEIVDQDLRAAMELKWSPLLEATSADI